MGEKGEGLSVGKGVELEVEERGNGLEWVKEVRVKAGEKGKD